MFVRYASDALSTLLVQAQIQSVSLSALGWSMALSSRLASAWITTLSSYIGFSISYAPVKPGRVCENSQLGREWFQLIEMFDVWVFACWDCGAGFPFDLVSNGCEQLRPGAFATARWPLVPTCNRRILGRVICGSFWMIWPCRMRLFPRHPWAGF